MASEKGHHDVVQTLLGAGADVNKTISYVSDLMFYYYSIKFAHIEEYYFACLVT